MAIALTGISDDLFKAVLRYLTLFCPAEKDLSFNRVSKLIGEIAPMIREGEIVRNRKTHPAPREAWIWAATRCLEARDAGKLTPPLTSHGYLLENITFWTPDKTAGAALAPAADTALSGSLKCRKSSRCLHFFYGGQLLFLLE